MNELHEGAEFAGFRVMGKLGSGGMAAVYCVEEPDGGRQMAMKILLQPDTPGMRQRFTREVQLMRAVIHPAVLAVHGEGEADGLPYFLMELQEGPLLSDVIELMATGRSANKLARPALRCLLGGEGHGFRVPVSRLSSSQARALTEKFIEVTDAVSACHRCGIFHLDVKPSNIFVSVTGELRLFDFGLAARAGDPPTEDGSAKVGTPRYMSPELIEQGRINADERADVYALGATLYELLTLKSAVNGTNVDELFDQARQGRVRPPRMINPLLPPDLETILLKALRRNGCERYPDAGSLTTVLRRFSEGREIVVGRRTLSQRIIDHFRFARSG